jgi:hypothetical protein
MVEGTATTIVACLATVRLYLWGTVVMLRGFSSASLFYVDALYSYMGFVVAWVTLCYVNILPIHSWQIRLDLFRPLISVQHGSNVTLGIGCPNEYVVVFIHL